MKGSVLYVLDNTALLHIYVKQLYFVYVAECSCFLDTYSSISRRSALKSAKKKDHIYVADRINAPQRCPHPNP